MKHNLPECAIKPLDVHQTPYINTSVEEGTWNYVDQKVQNAQKEIIFSIENTEYLDLSSMQLYASVNIFPINKTSPNVSAEITALTDSVAPVNNLLHSLWEKISLKCGTVELDNPTSSYAYKDYFLKLLNYGHEEKTTLFSSSLFYKDTAGEFDNYEVKTETEESVVIKKEGISNAQADTTIRVTKPQNTNAGFLQRRKLLMDNKGKIELMGQLQFDLFSTENYILPGTKLEITLFKNPDEFCLMGTDKEKYGINIVDIKLRIRTQTISKQVQNAHTLAISRNPACYLIKESKVVTHKLNTSGKTVTQKISEGKIPNKVILGLSNYSYKPKTNPFNFRNFDVSRIEFRVGKNQRPYTYTLDLDFATNHYLNGYMTLFDLSNKTNLGNNITREDYPNGYCLYGFNLEPILNCSGDFVSVSKEEEVTIKITFKTQPDETSLDLIFYIEYDKIIEFDKDKKVIE